MKTHTRDERNWLRLLDYEEYQKHRARAEAIAAAERAVVEAALERFQWEGEDGLLAETHLARAAASAENRACAALAKLRVKP